MKPGRFRLPAEMLSDLSVSERSTRWTYLLERFAHGGAGRAFLAEVGGDAVGFAAVGPQRSEDLHRNGYTGEIAAIYVLEAAQRRGVGQALLRHGTQHLLAHGHAAAALWVLKAACAYLESGIPMRGWL